MLKLISNRIIFLDILRAFAVIAMIQGHTIDILLQQSYKNVNSYFYYLWNFNRGLTAPIFLFTAGCVFTFVFKNKKLPFIKNPRVKKGLIRGIILIFIGYLIKFPTSNFINLKDITPESWQIFFAIDVLQLIGVGLILLIFLFYLNERFIVNFYKLMASSILILMLMSINLELVDWYLYINPFSAGYLYMGEGSKFPLLPNIIYILAGAIFGNYIVLNRENIKPSKFRLRIITSGVFLILIYELLNYLHHLTGNPYNILSKSTNLVFIRTGMVILIVYIIIEISLKINKLPKFIEAVGKYSLLIYVVHLFILYGSALNRGVAYYYKYSFNIMESIISALILILIMIFLAYVVNYLGLRNKMIRTR
ncbi:MAG: heparan-alpha-glucosaminide N-acetyltransferase domain-containing protein [Thermodesulfobacteriota bacterium]